MEHSIVRTLDSTSIFLSDIDSNGIVCMVCGTKIPWNMVKHYKVQLDYCPVCKHSMPTISHA